MICYINNVFAYEMCTKIQLINRTNKYLSKFIEICILFV